MRSGAILLILAIFSLAGCQMGLPGGKPSGKPSGGQGLVTEEISVLPLDAPAEGMAAEAAEPGAETEAASADAPQDSAAQPEAPPFQTAPDAETEPDAEAEAVPATPRSPEQLDCEGRGGLWTPAGETGAWLCLSPTRDGGKTCHRKSECEGECLARSMTCAPYSPLFGCNDILDKDGRRMTLCID